MYLKIIFCFCLLLASSVLPAQNKKPAAIIFDSDMGPDYDDVGAITMLHAFADNGRIRILATMASTKYDCVACVLSVFNTYFKKPDIPIGVPKGDALMLRDWQHWSDTVVAKYPHKIKSNEDAEDVVELYRKILSRQPPHSVTVVTVGFLTNLSNLLKSKADEYSPLNGEELVKEKVNHLVCMAGKFPEGYEFNLDKDIPSSQYVYANWPTNIIFSGFEIGMKIKVGLPLIHNKTIKNSPVKDVFRISIPLAKEDSAGRMSWDETAVLVAIKGYRPYYHLRQGHIEIAADGKDKWVNEGNRQAYLIESIPPETVQTLINKLIMHQPEK